MKEEPFMKLRTLIMAAFAVTFMATTAMAAPITEDFESEVEDGLAPNAEYMNVNGYVDIYTGPIGSGPWNFSNPAYVAEFGQPETAFVQNDVLANPNGGGEQFLTDEPNGPDEINEYLFAFAAPFSELWVDVYDFRRDGTPDPNAPNTLSLWVSDTWGGSWYEIDSYTLMGGEPDGWTLTLGNSSFGAMNYAALVYTDGAGDNGMGVDNLKFNVVPEPATFTLLGLGIAGIALRKRFAK
jgi:hypothetical protein